jgi:hypothetical protein
VRTACPAPVDLVRRRDRIGRRPAGDLDELGDVAQVVRVESVGCTKDAGDLVERQVVRPDVVGQVGGLGQALVGFARAAVEPEDLEYGGQEPGCI